MKQCPECLAEYEDSVNFCAKDGKAVAAKIASRARLCPHCANSIPEGSPRCPYCKADLSSALAPQWPTREEGAPEARLPSAGNKIPMKSKVILISGLVFFAVAIFLIGGKKERNESQVALQEKLTEIQDKEQKIQTLEAEFAKARQELQDYSNQLAESRTQLDESKKELSVAQQRLTIVSRELDRASSSRAQAPPRTASTPVEPISPAPPSAPTRRAAEPGLYETLRATSVYDEPSASGRTVSQISKGTRVNVVRSVGDWLEVRSAHGNPPGFIRRDDAVFVNRAN